MSRNEPLDTVVPELRSAGSGRLALFSGLAALFIGVAFAYLHNVVLNDWPDVALDGLGTMIGYFLVGSAFQLAVPVLCLTTFVFGTRARNTWTGRIGLFGASAALVGYALYVRACVEMIR
jgi:hypothetical protein